MMKRLALWLLPLFALLQTAYADTVPDYLRHPSAACTSTQVVRYLTPGARATCATVAFADIGSTPTTLAGYGITDAQSRVSGTCSTGNAIRAIAADGTVTCQSASAGGGTWGSITGTLSAQTDLQTALDGKDTSGAASTAQTNAEAYTDSSLIPYLTSATAASTYQPLDADLTAIAALTTTSNGRGFLALADAAAGRTYLGLGSLATSSAALPVTIAQTAHLWLDSYTSSTGAYTASRPACADLSDSSTGCAATIANYLTTASAASTYVPQTTTVNGQPLSGNVTVSTITGNAGTATALAANPTDCSASQYATAIAASGNLTCATIPYSDLSGAPTIYNQTIKENGTSQTQRPTLNLISGTGATVSCTDNSGATRTDCTVSASGGSGTVTTTGTPASGNLAKFSGTTSIVNGDLSGDCTTSGTLAITCTKTNGSGFGTLATLNVAPTATALATARTIAMTGDVTYTSGSFDGTGNVTGTATLANIPTATPAAGTILHTAITAPSTPATGKGAVYVDSTSKNIAVKDDAGVVKHGVQTDTGTANNYISAISDAGAITKSRPTCSTLSDSAASCSTDATNASNIASGTLALARIGRGPDFSAVVAGSAATTLTLAGLDLNTDGHYRVMLTLKNAAASNSTISPYYNADSTAGNYDSQVISGNSTTAGAARANTAVIGTIPASSFASATYELWVDGNAQPRAIGAWFQNTTTSIAIQTFGMLWRTASTNVTQIVVTASVSSSLGVGSKIEVWKM